MKADVEVPAARSAWAAALRDAGIAALVTVGLALPLIGLHADEGQGGRLYVATRFELVAYAGALVFFGRLAIFAFRQGRGPRHQPGPATAGAFADLRALLRRAGPALGPAALILTFAFPALVIWAAGGMAPGRQWVDLGIVILTYVMLGWGLNIVVGLAGLLDLGYVAFYAVGAYTYAKLATELGFSFWACLPLSGLFAALWGVLLGFPVLRLRGDYLAIVTLAFGEIIRLVLINWVDFTGGPNGISSIPRVTFFGLPFTPAEGGFADTFGITFNPMHRIIFLYYLILILALLTALVSMRLRRLPIGRAWEALREDEIACRSLGINTVNTKLTAFAIGAAFGGFAGSFFAVRQGLVSPESFNFMESAIILAIVVLGGMGSLVGVAVAAVALIGGMELLRELTVLKQWFGADFDPVKYRMLIFGLLMVFMMVWKPRGLISNRQPTVHLVTRKAVSGSLVREGHG